MLAEMGRLGNCRVLFAMAAEAEYGPHLRQRMSPLMTGVGPVEAAVRLTAALGVAQQAGDLPDLVVSLGSAGSPRLEQARVYQVSGVEYRDMDASALGFRKGVTPFLSLPARLPMPVLIPDFPSASLATGASVVSGAGYGATQADMVDMETFALLRACQHFDVPLFGLRGISDGIEEVKKLQDWTQYLHVVDKNLAEALDLLDGALANGLPDLP